MARRYVNPRGPASELARVWDQLPAAEQRRIVEQVRAALGTLKTQGEAQHPQRPAKVQVLNSARRARVDAAWSVLAETGRQIEQSRKVRLWRGRKQRCR